MEAEQVPHAMVFAALAEWERRINQRAEGAPRDHVRALLAAALSVCEAERQTGEAFADEPTRFTFGSSTITELMSRKHRGQPMQLLPVRRWVFTSPTELIPVKVES